MLERWSAVRRMLMLRCGLLALLAVLITSTVPGFSRSAHWVPAAIFLSAPIGVWVLERRSRKKVIKKLLKETPLMPGRS